MSASANKVLRIALTGRDGRMGSRLIALLAESRDIKLATDDEPIDVMIDFSSPAGTRAGLIICRERRIPMVIGTTGLEQHDHAAIDAAGKQIAVLQSANMSLGAAVLINLASTAVRMLGDDLDIEILESHHRFKKDAPSGTAKALADAIAKIRRTRPAIHSTRLGDEIGRHTVYLAALGERLELTHVATDRYVFARGALRAAAWLVDQQPGRYTMADLLGLK